MTIDPVYSRFRITPAAKESILLLARLKHEGPAAVVDQADVLRQAWAGVGATHLPDDFNFELIKRGIAWFQGDDGSIPARIDVEDTEAAVAARVLVRSRSQLNHKNVCRLHEIIAPTKGPHAYDETEEQAAYVDVSEYIQLAESGRFDEPNTEGSEELAPPNLVLFVCPFRKDVPELMQHMFDLVSPLAVPLGNALLHLNLTAIHPFYDGNSHLRTALSLGRLLSVTHPAVEPHVIGVLKRHWDGFFSGYEQAWREAVGPAYDPCRDVTSWVEWYVTAEVRFVALAAVAALAAITR